MCTVFGAFAHLCFAVVSSSELLHQSFPEVASSAQPEISESGTETQTSARSGCMQRPESQKVLQLPAFCEVGALKVLVLYCSGGPGGQKVEESTMFLEVEAAKLLFL